MTFGARRFLSLLSMILILVLMVLAFRYDAGRRIEGMEELMVAQGCSLADVISESSLHGLGLYNSLENETNRRLQNNAIWVARMDSVRELNSADLARLPRLELARQLQVEPKADSRWLCDSSGTKLGQATGVVTHNAHYV